jgi:hypothetical protein
MRIVKRPLPSAASINKGAHCMGASFLHPETFFSVDPASSNHFQTTFGGHP